MLICKLAGILSSRKITITELSDSIYVSRTALSQLVNNATKGIQYETLDKLCSYLKLSPNDILLHHPVDFECTKCDYVFTSFCFENFHNGDSIESMMHFNVYRGNIINEFEIPILLTVKIQAGIFCVDCAIFYNEVKLFERLFDAVPVEMTHIIESDIMNVLVDVFGEGVPDSFELDFNIEWV